MNFGKVISKFELMENSSGDPTVEILNGAIVWRTPRHSPQSEHSLNILNFDPNSMQLAQQTATINFEERILACQSVPNRNPQSAQDWLVLLTKTEAAVVELQQPHGLVTKATKQQEEIEEEVH